MSSEVTGLRKIDTLRISDQWLSQVVEWKERTGSHTHLSHALHGAPNPVGGSLKTVQIPAGYFGNNIIQAGLKVG